MRNRQIVGAVGSGARRIGDLLAPIYPGLAPELRAAALMTLRAHVEYLADRGQIGATHGLSGMTIFPSSS
jgi:hypothetical protein